MGRLWTANDFVSHVSEKVGITPEYIHHDTWENVTALEWSHPKHETRTQAGQEHFLAVLLNDETEMDYSVNGGKTLTHTLNHGSVSYIPNGRMVDWNIKKPMTVANIFIPESLMKLACEASDYDYNKIVSGRNWLGEENSTIQHLALMILNEIKKLDKPDKLFIDSLSLAIASKLIDMQSGNDILINQKKGALSKTQLARALQYMETHYEKSFGLEKLGQIVGMSEFHFARSFKTSTGLAPIQYLTQLRLKKALALLATSERPIAEIAEAVGFGTQSHMNHVFRRHIGTSPGAYRLMTK